MCKTFGSLVFTSTSSPTAGPRWTVVYTCTFCDMTPGPEDSKTRTEYECECSNLNVIAFSFVCLHPVLSCFLLTLSFLLLCFISNVFPLMNVQIAHVFHSCPFPLVHSSLFPLSSASFFLLPCSFFSVPSFFFFLLSSFLFLLAAFFHFVPEGSSHEGCCPKAFKTTKVERGWHPNAPIALIKISAWVAPNGPDRGPVGAGLK